MPKNEQNAGKPANLPYGATARWIVFESKTVTNQLPN